jgi:hypothetical protein
MLWTFTLNILISMNLVFANSDGIEVVNDEYYRVDDIATPMGRGVTTKDEHAILRL